MSLFDLVEAIVSLEKSSSDAELEEMLRGLKKHDLVRLCKKSGLKASGNKPELIGRVLVKWRHDSGVSAGEESTGTAAVAPLGKARAILEQAKDWTKVLTGLNDFTFMDLYAYLVSSRNRTFDRESLKAFKSLKAYKYFSDDLVRNVYACHIPNDELIAIKSHCFSSLKASTAYSTFLALKQNGRVVAAQCSCVAGQGEACSHVAALYNVLFGRQDEAETHTSPC